jgi:hypothetical protein
LGLSSTSTTNAQRQAAWRAEFERLGELLVYDNSKPGAIYDDEAKRQAALRWLSEQAQLRRNREVWTLRAAWGAFLVAIATLIVGIIDLLGAFRD